MIYMTHTNNVLVLRARAGLTQVELAQAAGVSHPSVSRIERGLTTAYPASQIRIADALGKTLEDVFPNG